MIPLHRFLRRAFYDENGDIILGNTSEPEPVPEAHVEESTPWNSEPPEPATILQTEEDVLRQLGILPAEEDKNVSKELSSTRLRITEEVLREGLRQYQTSLASAKPIIEDLEEETLSFLKRFFRFLAQPIWIPGKDEVKKRSRGYLFAVDVFKFGGTFAGIFLALFLSLNYQSFWQIAQARVDSLLSPPTVGSAGDALANDLQDKLKLLPSLAQAGAGNAGELLSYLPEVGPPDNRLIIPKMDLNIPLVNPSTDSLIRGDWTQVEQDIQTSLQDGVAHYPGTAVPGQAGNFFITGHSSYYPWAPGKYKTVFARLHDLNPGDEYWVYFNGDKHRYIVRTKKEVQPSDISVLNQPADQRISTLMTCTPIGTTLRRLIIVSDEIDPSTGEVMKVGERPAQQAPRVIPESLSI